jgi:ribosomal protein S7
VSEIEELREKAAHTRWLADCITDRPAREALEALANEFEEQAEERALNTAEPKKQHYR